MSAKITVVLFILICLEIGALLVVLPWHHSWEENNLLFALAESLHAPWLTSLVLSSYFRGFVSGLGAVNILIAIWEMAHFRSSVRSFGGDAPLPD